MKNVVINHEHTDGHRETKFVGNFEDACKFIDGYNHEPSSKKIRKFDFSGRNLQINPAGFGPTRLVVSECEQSTIDEYREHLKELWAKRNAENKRRRKEYEGRRRKELTQECKGWYIVELELLLPHRNIELGGAEHRYTNWRILADSQAEAFEQAINAANDKLPVIYEVLSNPVDADISYVGMWTDELEDEFSTKH